MSQTESPSVAVDGRSIRRIREQKQLTQLYVAKVVGVTTDTVSRWENRRYPSMRRDNAVKLAEALDVDLTDIVTAEEDSPVPCAAPRPISHRWVLLFLLFVIASGAAWWFLSTEDVMVGMHAQRTVPHNAAPGSRVLVRLDVSVEQPLTGAIIKEVLPRGVRLVNAVPAVSSWNSEEGVARWMMRKPQNRIGISYLVDLSADLEPATQVVISGELIVHAQNQRSSAVIDSMAPMTVVRRHWVDDNGDGVIDDLEILNVSDWLDGSEEMHREWDQIEAIWEAGGYAWDLDTSRFVPVLSENAAPSKK